jgi:glucokinase
MKKFLGIEIGGTKLQVVSGNGYEQIDHRISDTVDRAAGAAGIRERIEKALQHWKGQPLDGIGVGFGGPVDRCNNTIWTSYHIEGWTGFALADWLTGLTGAPVVIENDCECGRPWAKRYMERARNHEYVFYVPLGSGVAAAWCSNQKTLSWFSPGEGEFGHIRLDKSGRHCSVILLWLAVNEKIRSAADANPDSELALLANVPPGAEAKILMEAIPSSRSVCGRNL